MKFGIFYEMFVPPSEAEAEARIIRETVDQIVHADKNGFDHVWLTEHHFLKGFSHMSAPEVLFGAAAYQTEHIRFGFGLALTPPSYNHPVRIAERVAMLDCLSNGRVDVGSGRSTTPAELYGFGIDPEQSRAQWQEGVDAVARLLAEEEVELDGEFVKSRPAPWCHVRCRSRTRRCGWVASAPATPSVPPRRAWECSSSRTRPTTTD